MLGRLFLCSFIALRTNGIPKSETSGTASGRAALQPSRGFRGISSPEGLRYSTVPLTTAPSCVGWSCRSRGTQQTGGTSVIGKPVYAGGPLRAGAGDGRGGGALPHTPASPENSFSEGLGEGHHQWPLINGLSTNSIIFNLCLCFHGRNGVTYTCVGLTRENRDEYIYIYKFHNFLRKS